MGLLGPREGSMHMFSVFLAGYDVENATPVALTAVREWLEKNPESVSKYKSVSKHKGTEP